jgi:hypothetical protein
MLGCVATNLNSENTLDADFRFCGVAALWNVSQRPIAAFFGADADGVFDGEDEDFAVAHLSGGGEFDDGVDNGIGEVVGDNDLELDFRQRVDLVLGAAVDFGVTFLSPVPAYFSDGHALYADFQQAVTYVVKFERPYDRFDFFHANTGEWG